MQSFRCQLARTRSNRRSNVPPSDAHTAFTLGDRRKPVVTDRWSGGGKRRVQLDRNRKNLGDHATAFVGRKRLRNEISISTPEEPGRFSPRTPKGPCIPIVSRQKESCPDAARIGTTLRGNASIRGVVRASAPAKAERTAVALLPFNLPVESTAAAGLGPSRFSPWLFPPSESQ